MSGARTCFPRFAGLLGAAGAALPCLLLPWILPPPPAVQAAVMIILAGHGYLAVALVRTTWRRLRRRAATTARSGRSSAPSRWLAATVVIGLLATAHLPATPAQPYSPARLVALSSGDVSHSSTLRSGYSGSLVPWDTLGAEGQTFVQAGPKRAEIAQAAGHAALDPVRVYVGVRSVPTLGQRARLAITELERSGAFARSTILVVVPTGSGWVNPAAVASAEYLTAGDLATVAVQYAERPSWAEYLLGTGRAEDTATTLVSAVRARLERIPSPLRPQLLVFGESLGAIAARSASTWADQSLLVGAPGSAWFPASPQRGMALLHADDPVGWWSPRLLFQRPHGWPGRWLPLVSFWQVTGALLMAIDAAPGHGHHYGPELAAAWAPAIRP